MRYGFFRGNEFGATTLDLLDAPLDLNCPNFLDFRVFSEAGDKAIRKPRPLLRGELERLRFHDLKFVWHTFLFSQPRS
jgi:hypothetical protein